MARLTDYRLLCGGTTSDISHGDRKCKLLSEYIFPTWIHIFEYKFPRWMHISIFPTHEYIFSYFPAGDMEIRIHVGKVYADICIPCVQTTIFPAEYTFSTFRLQSIKWALYHRHTSVAHPGRTPHTHIYTHTRTIHTRTHTRRTSASQKHETHTSHTHIYTQLHIHAHAYYTRAHTPCPPQPRWRCTSHTRTHTHTHTHTHAHTH